MRPYNELSQSAQFRRLRTLALSALPAWGLDVQRVRPLSYWENATFRVDAAQGSFLLRVHRPGYRTQGQIQGELAWLRALGARTDLAVQEPLGEPVLGRAPGVPQARWCTLLRWAHGRILRKPTARHCGLAGAAMAQLHDFAEGFRERLDRPVWDTTDVFQMPRDAGVLALLPDADWRTWESGLARLAAIQDGLGRGAQEFGLVHVDLHFSNLVFRAGQAVPIDFDDGGWSHYALDLSTPWMRIRRLAEPERGWAAFVEGYTAVRELPVTRLALLPELAALEPLMLPRWLQGQLHRHQVQGWPAKRLPEFVAGLREWGL